MNKRYIYDIRPKRESDQKIITPLAVSDLQGENPSVDVSYSVNSSSFTPREISSKKESPKIIWYIACVALVALVVSVSLYFAKAHVVVTPRTTVVTIREPLIAYKDKTEGLVFDSVTVTDTISVPVTEVTSEYVERAATGRVVLYNNHSTEPQRLLIDTRLEAVGTGKIYKTKTPVVIPGKKLQGGIWSPGSVEVDIYASEVGAEYNSEPTDFVIYGFKGGPKAKTFYARSTVPITGGVKGEEFTASDVVLNTLYDKLKTELATRLLTQARFDSPPEFILYEGLGYYTIDTKPTIVKKEEGKIEASLSGTYSAFLLSEEVLKRAIVEAYLDDVPHTDISIPEIRALGFSLANESVRSEDIKNTNIISITTNLPIQIIWNVDELLLAERLKGIKTAEFSEVIKEFSAIANAELTVKPFWKHSVPLDENKILIDNTLVSE